MAREEKDRYVLLNDGRPPVGFDASRPVSDEAERALAERLRGLRAADLAAGEDWLLERLRQEGRLFGDIADAMLPLVVEEYERRVREAAEKLGPGMVRWGTSVKVGYDGGSGRLEARVEMDEARRAQAVGYLAATLEAVEGSFGDRPTIYSNAADWLLALAAALLEGRAGAEGAGGGTEGGASDGPDGGCEEACAYLVRREGEPYRAMVRWFALDLSQRLFDWSTYPERGLQLILGSEPAQVPRALPMPELEEDHFWTSSAQLYHGLRVTVSDPKHFGRVPDSGFPTALLNAGDAVGYAVMRPPDTDLGLLDPEQIEHWEAEMWRQREGLDDLDADVLDGLTAVWLERSPHHPERLAYVMIDELIDLRQKERKKGGSGRRGGYETKQRHDIVEAITHLRNVMVDLRMQVPEATARKKIRWVEKRVRSYVIAITDVLDSPQPRLDGYAAPAGIIYRPGQALSLWLENPHMRQMTLLAAQALRYDPYRQRWEKRLARSLSWRWRVGASREGQYRRPYGVADLLRMADQKLDGRRPQETRRRLEKALDVLKADGVIAYWQPDAEAWDNPLTTSRKGWKERWLASTYLIEPPDVIKDLCDRVADAATSRQRAKALTGPARPIAEQDGGDLGERLKAWRKEHGLSQVVLADRLSGEERSEVVSQGTISKIENSRVVPNKKLREKIERLMDGE